MSFYNRPTTPKQAISGTIINDITVPNGPEDSISCLTFSPVANHLAVASWDSKIRIYDHTQNVNGNPVRMIDFEKPVLSCDWSKDGTKVIGAGLDQKAMLQDLNGGGLAVQVAAHEAPIKSVRFFDAPGAGAPMIATASWDKTIRYWDLRQQTPAATVDCAERIYSMDVKGSLLVAVTADRKVHVVDLSNPTSKKTTDSKLVKQIRVVTCARDGKSYAYGSVEGRTAMTYLDVKDKGNDMSFRCHRDTQNGRSDVYAVNDISFHPVHTGTFSTAGSDGSFNFWDRFTRSRLQIFPSVGSSITSTAFNHDGTLFAYGVSYDWSKGFTTNTAQYPIKVMLHKVIDDELKAKTARK